MAGFRQLSVQCKKDRRLDAMDSYWRCGVEAESAFVAAIQSA